MRSFFHTCASALKPLCLASSGPDFAARAAPVCPRGQAAFGGMPLSRRNTWKATLSVPLPGLWQCKRACAAKVCVAVVSRSVFLSGKAAKKNYEHPCHARGRNLAEIASTHMLPRGPPSTTALAYPGEHVNVCRIRDNWPGKSGDTRRVAPKGGE